MAATPDTTRTPGRAAEPSRLEYRILDMDCAEEVTALERELAPLLAGEDRLGFDLLSSGLAIMTAGGLSDDQIAEAVARTGLRAEPWQELARAHEPPRNSWRRH